MKSLHAGTNIWFALILASLAGPAMDAGFPGLGFWPLTLLGVAVFLYSLIGRGPWTGLLIGGVTGFTFYGLHISWLTLYLGPVPWLALTTVMSLWFAVTGLAVAIVLNRGPRQLPTRFGRLVAVPLVVAGLWTARESISSVWPYGGFAWARLAESQSQSPLADLVGWAGITGTGFVMALFAAFLVQLVRETGWSVAARAAIAATAALVLVAIPTWPAQLTGSTRVAAVQGNANAALDNSDPPGTILNNHVSATLPLVGQKVDMVIWPENSSDIDPERNSQAAAVLDYVATVFDAPLLVGTITKRDNTYYNTSLLWQAGHSSVDWYDKKHPVPFAEYMPDRVFFRALAAELVDLVTRDYGFGQRDAIFNVGGTLTGMLICYDVSDDALVRDLVTGGAEMIIVQSNNADFGRSDQGAQQLAIARLRAVETGRSVVHLSTTGVSAIIAPDGSTIDQLVPFEAGVMVDDVPLATGTTPAVRLGDSPAWLLSALGILGLLLVVIRRPKTRKAGSS
ncbi:MAG: apolipoprotein N-acyltransferase [Microbacteriaceae bacterium]